MLTDGQTNTHTHTHTQTDTTESNTTLAVRIGNPSKPRETFVNTTKYV